MATEKKPSVTAEVVDTKRGFPIFDRNPSVPVPSSFGSRERRIRVNSGNKVMIVGADTGELLGDGHAGFFEMQEVDETQFVKLYLAGIKQTQNLTKAGLQVFELVYHQMRASPQTDRLELNHYLVKKYGVNISIQTFRRGLRELLEHEFLFRSTSADVYFVNINFIFNGNRITLAKSYYLKGTGDQLGLDLPPPEKAALPSPKEGKDGV